MTVESVGQAVAIRAQPETAHVVPPAVAVRPVIDAETIKTILYLGLKGDIALRGTGTETIAGATQAGGRGVDTYA
jgi:hypothetical protein